MPLMIDLFCGLGGGTEGALAEGYDCIGFDRERHVYGAERYPAQLVLQDALTIHGSQCRHAAYIWASPPCTEFSYMAMPWSRAKQIAAALRDPIACPFPEGYTGSRTIAQLTALFDACFRIQREASEAAGRYIPMVVENVKGAQPWVGKAKARFGSFYLWGDVAMVGNRVVSSVPAFGQWTRPMRSGTKNGGNGSWWAIEHGQRTSEGTYGSNPVRGEGVDGRKIEGFNFHEHEKTGKPGRSFQSAAVGQKVAAYSDPRRNGGKGVHMTSPRENIGGVKNGNDWFGSGENCSEQRRHASRSDSRRAASAQIAKIPFALSQYIARAYKPRLEEIA